MTRMFFIVFAVVIAWYLASNVSVTTKGMAKGFAKTSNQITAEVR